MSVALALREYCSAVWSAEILLLSDESCKRIRSGLGIGAQNPYEGAPNDEAKNLAKAADEVLA